MKKRWKLLCFGITMLLLSCSQKPNKEQIAQISFFLDQYYNYYYDYPITLDVFVEFCGERLPYSNSSIRDEYQIAQSFLEKNRITWSIDDKNYPIQELTIICKDDTIIHKYDSIVFPCLDRLIDLYMDIYFEYPKSLENLVKHYNAIQRYQQDFWPTQVCDSVTILGLKKCQSKNILDWEWDEGNLLVMVRNDTVGYWLNYSQCDLLPYDIITFHSRFYDSEGTGFFPSEETNQHFKLGIRELGKCQNQINEGGISGWLLIRYNKTEGLSPLCECDSVDLKTDYYLDMSAYLKRYTAEHGLSAIVFSAPVTEIVK